MRRSSTLFVAAAFMATLFTGRAGTNAAPAPADAPTAQAPGDAKAVRAPGDAKAVRVSEDAPAAQAPGESPAAPCHTDVTPALTPADAPKIPPGRRGWELVGLYDAGAVLVASRPDPKDAAPGFTWRPPAGMQESCGPSRGPFGMGVIEAESISNKLSSALVLLLRRTSDTAPALNRSRVSVVLDGGIILEPAVLPRALNISVSPAPGTDAAWAVSQVRQMLAMELCLEHRVGRGWIGGDAGELRQAFMLDLRDSPPKVGSHFIGQGAPVPALLSPSDACFEPEGAASSGPVSKLEGSSSELHPADVWNARLRPCGVKEQARGARLKLPMLPLSLGSDENALKVDIRRTDLDIVVRKSDPGSSRIELEATYEGALLTGTGLELYPAGRPEEGLVDLLTLVPFEYPVLGPQEDPQRYTVLLIPAWQLGAGPDPVGRLLNAPDRLRVSVRGETSWLELEPWNGRRWRGMVDWGYPLSAEAARAPIALPSLKFSPLAASYLAHRSVLQATFIVAGLLLVLFLLVGARRLPELCRPAPELTLNAWGEPETGKDGGKPEGEAKP